MDRLDPASRWEAAELDLHRVEIESRKQDIGERKRYAKAVFLLICTWLLALFLVLGLQGFKTGGFSLSDSVLLALVGGTTVNVIGIFIVVVSYLFPKDRSLASSAPRFKRKP